jgi:lipopolysaccharide/colanic/teichoic acid biosynthesis glycosyltransferase
LNPELTCLAITTGSARTLESPRPMSIKSFSTPLGLGQTFPESAGSAALVALSRRPALLAKRVIDMVGAVVGLIMLAPLMLLIGLAVRLETPGPMLFRQRRMGKGGKTFTFLKFRTMHADAEQRLAELEAHNEAMGGVLFKMKNDPRITPLGRILRRTSLDELPQLINVLRGEMSLVGPRPLQLRDSDRLEQLFPEAFAQRLSVLPGLTGAWQVGGRSNVDSAAMLDLDLDYVANWSLGLDLAIVWRTFAVVIYGHGAY